MNRFLQERTTQIRFAKFGTVGLIGVGVNLGFYALFKDVVGIADFFARAVAIELSILNNFVFNFIWTWADRGRKKEAVLPRLLKYHATTLVSSFGVTLFTGWLLMLILPEKEWAPYASHLTGIGLGMVTNFLFADWWVFRGSREAD